jgi:hypothetical protein
MMMRMMMMMLDDQVMDPLHLPVFARVAHELVRFNAEHLLQPPSTHQQNAQQHEQQPHNPSQLRKLMTIGQAPSSASTSTAKPARL